MIKRFIIRGVSKKFKGVQKLPAQKTPKHSSKWLDQEADLKARAKFDSIFDTGKGSASKGFSKVGMGIASTKHAAATTLASKTAGKYWNKNLPKELRKQRSTIAGFARTNRSKVSVRGLKKAKQKGFIKTLKKQDKKFERIRSKTSELFTSSKGPDPFKTYTKSTFKKLTVRNKIDFNKTKSDWGFDPFK